MSESILIVDDEEPVRRMVMSLVEARGFTALEAESAERALDLVNEETVDLVITDLRMSGMDGLSLAKSLLERDPDRPVLLMTAHADLESARRAVDIGVYEYFVKPFHVNDLAAGVKRALEHRRMALETQAYQKDLERRVKERTAELVNANDQLQREIADRKEAEKGLQRSEKRLRGLVKNLPEGVYLLNEERRLVVTNPAAQDHLSALTGAAEGEVITHVGNYSLEDLLTHRGEGLPPEVVLEGPPDRVFEVAVRPIVEEMIESGWVVVVREVTQERKIQERMQQQSRLASIGQLAAGIAHDFNNLLTTIVGFSELLEMRPDMSGKAKEDLRTIASQGHRGSQLIRQILDFSRKRVVQVEPLDLVAFLEETVKLLERTLPETIQIFSAFGEDDCVVEANLSQMQDVITNLAINARDAMPDGGECRIGLSHLHLETGEPPPFPDMKLGLWAVLRISDTGVGMSREVLEHLYEPFFTTKPAGKGTGLGLAQVYGIVKQQGGEIAVESQPGKGTTFTIYLPQVEKATKPSLQTGEVQRGRGETVLVVEDEAEVLRAARTMLKHLNYRVLTAANGQEALSVYDAHRDEIALVLTDVVMPQMGGMELFKLLKEKHPGIRVVMMTGYPLGEKGELQIPEDAAGLLEKPITLRQVGQVVRRVLDRKNER